jgi:plasmid stabilization system protein ParE
MKRTIVWSNRAINNLAEIQAYLSENWSEAVQKEFIIKTFTIVELIAENSKIGTLENPEKGIRGFLLSKLNRLFYRYTNTKLIILNIFDTRQRPKKKIIL